MIGLLYQHKKKKSIYCVLEVANGHTTDSVKFPEIVVYVDCNRRVWARPKAEFLEIFSLYEGKLGQNSKPKIMHHSV